MDKFPSREYPKKLIPTWITSQFPKRTSKEVKFTTNSIVELNTQFDNCLPDSFLGKMLRIQLSITDTVSEKNSVTVVFPWRLKQTNNRKQTNAV